MNRIAARHTGPGRLLCLLYCLLVMPCALAGIDVLDRIDITRETDRSTIHIHLNIPVRYKSHAPGQSGDLLRINVEPVPSPGLAEDILFGRESIQWSADKQVPLFEVVYESEGFSATTITLRFQDEVEFEVQQTSDFRSIDVAIKHSANRNADAEHAVQESRPAASGTESYTYAINLLSSLAPVSTNSLPDLEALRAYRVYTTDFQKDGQTWHRLRLGFFRSEGEAAAARKELKAYFPDAWITAVTADERLHSDAALPGSSLPGAATIPGDISEAAGISPGPEPVQTPGPGRVSPGQLDALMEAARQKMTAQDYAGAIRLYTKILQYPETGVSRDALEYLGLSRERNGQVAHAKQAYEDYLKRYPEGAGAERVSQRLAALITASKKPRGKLRTVKARRDQDSSWDIYGGFSQFYRRDVNTSNIDEDNELTTVSQSSVSSDMDITGRMRNENYDLRTRFTGGYLHDFLDDGSGSETTVSSIYFDARDKKHDVSMRLGRQSRSTGGVLGRFDGLLLGIPLGSIASLSPVGGFPVDSSTDGFDADRYFYGLTLEFDGFADGWDANAFVIEQRVDSITDRRAVGSELRYFDPTRSFFNLVDYDIYYNKLNIWQFLGNWTAPDRTTVNLVLDYRNSPILATSNALIGQTASSIDDLLDSFSKSEIEDFARDRTATNKLATLGASRPINEKLQLSGDVTVTNLSDTDASAGVEAVDGTGNEYFYNFQLTGSNLIKTGDIAILGVRYSNASTTKTTSLSLNTRYPFSRELRVNPRLRVDFRKNNTDDTNQLIYRPSMRLTYRVKRRFQLEVEAGGEWSDREIVDGSEKDRSYFAIAGYRLDF